MFPVPPSLSLHRANLAVLCSLVALFAELPSAPLLAGEGSLSSVAEREIARRQGLLTGASEALAKGIQLTKEGKAEQASSILLESYRAIPDAPMARELREATKEAFATAGCAYARQLLAEARYQEAHQILDTILAADMYPGHKEAGLIKKRAGDPDRYPPALSPDHLAMVKKVKDLLTYADSATSLGDYEAALATYTKVLQIDPFNTAARRGMDQVEQKKAVYLDSAYDHTRSRLLNDVSKQWETPVPPSTDMTNAFLAGRTEGVTLGMDRRAKVMQKLRTLRMSKVDFSAASLDEVIEFLRITSRNVDPDGRGVDFIMSAPQETRARTMSLTLNDMPLEEVVRYVVDLAGAAYRVEDSGVVITSLTDTSTAMISKSYRVPPDFLQSADAGSGPSTAPAADPFAPAAAGGAPSGLQIRRMGAKEFLAARGVTFTDAASASFSPMTSTLVVRNTAPNIALIDALVEQSVNNAPKQVQVTVRIMEVNEDLLSDVQNEILLGQGSLPGNDRVFFGGGTPRADAPGYGSTTEGIRSTGAIIGQPGINELLALSKGEEIPSIDSRSPSAVRLLGQFTDPQFLAYVHALNQKTGKDLVSMPSVVARGGQKASVRLVREFPYPTEFDPPEIPQQVGNVGAVAISASGNVSSAGAGNAPITPTTPTTFEVKELGTVLEIEPVISPDGRTVDLAVTPSNTEFEGFVDYGSDITSTGSTNTFDPVAFVITSKPTSFVVDNPILQPVFRKSGITTSVTVWDGNTIVLGGVLSEKVTDINDKVPIVGDIPLIGKLWQGKTKQTVKKCVMMFVTVKVIDPGGQMVNPPQQAADLAHQALGGG